MHPPNMAPRMNPLLNQLIQSSHDSGLSSAHQIEASKVERREKAVNAQEKDLLHRDKLLKQKEYDFRNNIEQTASPDAYILSLKEKLKTQEAIIESLHSKMLA